MNHSWRSLYASGKVKTAADEFSAEISTEVRTSKSKVVVLGNSGVGKTSIIYRHRLGNDLGPCNPTIGASFITCDTDINGESVQLQIWDTAGQERFRCMVPMYMRNAAAALIVYDITSRQSFDDVEKWIQELNRCAGSDPILILIANKGDLDRRREVASGEGVTKACVHNAKFYEITAFDQGVIDSMLVDVAKFVYDKRHGIVEEEGVDSTVLISAESDAAEKSIRQKCCSL